MKLVRLDALPVEGVSHNSRITKRVMLRRGELPHLTQFAQSRLRPGEIASAHAHADMVEVFLVEAGEGTIIVDGVPHALSPGSCIAIEPGESHEITCMGNAELVLTYFGIAI